MGMGGMMKQMKAMMGGRADELELMAQSMDPDLLAEDMVKAEHGALGPNPFTEHGGANSSALPGLGGGLPGLGGAPRGTMPSADMPGLEGLGMPGMPARGGSKKNRKPRPKKGKRK